MTISQLAGKTIAGGILLFSLFSSEKPLGENLRSVGSGLGFLSGITIAAYVLSRLSSPSNRWFSRLPVYPLRLPLWVLMTLSLGLNLAVSLFVFEGRPRLDDGTTYLFQARIFASGHLTLTPPPRIEFSSQFGMIADRTWYSQYPPGFPLLLVPFVWLGIPWLANPLFAALTVGVLGYWGHEYFSPILGKWAAILLTFSPFALFLAGSHLSHSSAHLLAVVAYLLAFNLRRSNSVVPGIGLGVVLGYLFLIRPVTALALAGGMIPVLIGYLHLKRRRGVLPLSALVCSGLLVSSLAFWYNKQTTGEALLFGYEKLFGKQHTLGFGKNPWGAPHTPATGLLHTNHRLHHLNQVLSYMPVPFLILALLPFLTGAASRSLAVLVACPTALLSVYYCYYYKEFFFIPRFLAESTFVFMILGTAGLFRLAELVCSAPNHRLHFVGWFCGLALLVGLGLKLPGDLHRYGTSYGDVEDQLAAALQHLKIARGIIFMSNNESDNDYYSTGFYYNELNPLAGDLIFVRDCGARNREFQRLRPELPCYGYTYHSKWDVGVMEPLMVNDSLRNAGF